MKFARRIRVGSGPKSADRLYPVMRSFRAVVLFMVSMPFVGITAVAQSLYKYKDENGEWIYTDRPPEDEQTAEIRRLLQANPRPLDADALEEILRQAW